MQAGTAQTLVPEKPVLDVSQSAEDEASVLARLLFPRTWPNERQFLEIDLFHHGWTEMAFDRNDRRWTMRVLIVKVKLEKPEDTENLTVQFVRRWVQIS